MAAKKKRKRKNKVTTLLFVVLFVVFVTFLLAEFILLKYTRIFDGDNSKINGAWTTEIETTDIIVNEASLWLCDVQGEQIDLDSMRDTFETCDVECRLSFDKETKTYQMEISKEDYEMCYEQAISELSQILEAMVMNRLDASGIELEDTGMTLDELIQSTIGNTTEEYLKELGPKIMPTLEELESRYNYSGEYLLSNGVLKRAGMDDCKYVIDGDTLILAYENGESVVYKSLE